VSIVLDAAPFVAVERGDRDLIAIVKRERLANPGATDQRWCRPPGVARGHSRLAALVAPKMRKHANMAGSEHGQLLPPQDAVVVVVSD